jgi:hypothetical protein
MAYQSSSIQTLTVGIGLAPIHALHALLRLRSRTLPPIGNYTLP